MALAAYIFIQGVDITDNNIKALVAAANLLCVLGQQPQNTNLIASAKAVAAYYVAKTDAYYAAAANTAVAAADNPANTANANAAIAANYAKSAATNTAYSNSVGGYVNVAYADNPNNLPRAFTCAAGLIYLNIYTLLTQ